MRYRNRFLFLFLLIWLVSTFDGTFLDDCFFKKIESYLLQLFCGHCDIKICLLFLIPVFPVPLLIHQTVWQQIHSKPRETLILSSTAKPATKWIRVTLMVHFQRTLHLRSKAEILVIAIYQDVNNDHFYIWYTHFSL